jgi:beta-lactamase regulating signal transducer with metallopeptidase domain
MNRMRQLYIFHERSHFDDTDTAVLLTSFTLQNALPLVALKTG